jgi:hypothetical protein
MTFKTTVGSIVVTTTLYGPVNAERLAKEQAKARHRAEQLQPPTSKPERVRRQSRDTYEEDSVWDRQPFQSTGR